MQQVTKQCASGKEGLTGWAALLACLGALAWAPALRAQITYSETNVTVATIGGGPPSANFCASTAGFVNGNTLEDSQFDGPVAMALDSLGNLFIADKTNNAVREVTSAGNTGASLTVTSRYLTNLNSVVGVAVDAADNLYVLTQSNNVKGRNALRKYNYSLNLLFSNSLPYPPSALAVSADSSANLFVAFTNGVVLEYAQAGAALVHTNTILSANNLKIGGIAWRSDGVLAVSSQASNAIYLLAGTNNSAPTLYAGGGANGSTPGWVDGILGFSEFNQPAGLAWSPDFQLVVADRMNNALRRINANGNTSTIYGVSSSLWGTSDCSAGIFAGWVDGGFGANHANATGRAPASVLVAPSGTVYVTELYYNLLREVQGVAFGNSTNASSGTNSSGSTNTVLLPPTFSPAYGYFPECQTITITSSVPSVYYTTDGTVPTTNSAMLQLTINLTNAPSIYQGTLQWCDSLHDLTYLHLIAASGTNVSAVTNGVGSPVNEIGFPSPRIAGSGSTAVIPVVINLQSNAALRSLQFDVEIIPTTAGTPAITNVVLLHVTTNDFLQLAGPSPGNSPVNIQAFNYPAGAVASNGVGLYVYALGANSGLNVLDFAAPVLLEVPIPPTAANGQRYTISVLNPTGTSDGAQASVPLTPMATQFLTVSNVLYFEGDSSPSSGYDAGEFGNGALNNSDVNNALLASVGIHVPYTFSDAFSAMDVYPETAGGEMGDGFITFLDVQHILLRSLGIETNNWIRFWTNGALSHERIPWFPGEIVRNGIPSSTNFGAIIQAARAAAAPQPDLFWLRQASIHAGTIAGLIPGQVYSIPLYVNVLPGYGLSGLQFRATLVPNGNAPTPGRIQFSAAPGLPALLANEQGLSPNDLICAWSLTAPFTPALQGSNALGWISFQVPANASAGQSYTLRFSGVDGSPDLDTTYQLESVPGTAWVASAALAAPQITSDEWRTNFFGSLASAAAQDDADADGDGMANWQEYLAGTNPTNALSTLQFLSPSFVSAGAQSIHLSWLTAPGRLYVLESSPAPGGGSWTPVNTNLGDGNLFQIVLTNHPGSARFYLIQLIQP